jgi:hypothetical protein
MSPPVLRPDGRSSPTAASTYLHRYPAGERIRYHLLVLILATLVLALASLLRFDSQDRLFVPVLDLQLPTTCVSHQFFGWDCPGCGLTRGFVALVHGQWRRAWDFNPGTYLAVLLVILQMPYRVIQIRRTQLGIPETRHPRVEATCLLATVFVLFGQWVLKRLV